MKKILAVSVLVLGSLSVSASKPSKCGGKLEVDEIVPRPLMTLASGMTTNSYHMKCTDCGARSSVTCDDGDDAAGIPGDLWLPSTCSGSGKK